MALVSDNTGKFLRDKQTNKPTAIQEECLPEKNIFCDPGTVIFPTRSKKMSLKRRF